MQLAWPVARALGVDRRKEVLFPAVARVLGKSWEHGKHGKQRGYALVAEYAAREGIGGFLVTNETATARKKRPLVAPVTSDDFLMSYEWRKLRMVVLKKRGARCECCGATPADGVTVINVDHIKPRKLFPELALEESNLQVLCSPCNHGKGNWDQTDWRGPSSETVQ